MRSTAPSGSPPTRAWPDRPISTRWLRSWHWVRKQEGKRGSSDEIAWHAKDPVGRLFSVVALLGAVPVPSVGAATNSPVTLLDAGLRPRYLGVTKHVGWQTASGDHSVPNVIARRSRTMVDGFLEPKLAARQRLAGSG